MRWVPLLPHFRDEKTEIQGGFVSLFICFAADMLMCLITGVAPHFTGGLRKYLVCVSYSILSTARKNLSFGTICPGMWSQGEWAWSSPLLLLSHPHLPSSMCLLLFSPFSACEPPVSDSQYSVSVYRQEVLSPCACSSPSGLCCTFQVKSREATTQACGCISPRQAQGWQAGSSSMDLPVLAPSGHKKCPGVDSCCLTFPSMALMRTEW